MAGSIISSVAGSAASGLISGAFGGSKSSDEFERGAAASQQIVNPQPFQGRSLFGGINPQGQFSLNSRGQQQFQKLLGQSNKFFNASNNFNRNDFRDRLMQASMGLQNRREQQAFDGLESRLFNSSGVNTGTQRQVADFKNDIEDARFGRALQAEMGADQMARGRLGDFANAFGLMTNFDDRGIGLQQQSLQGAQALAPFAINNPAMAQAGAFRAQNTQDFFDGLGGTVGGLVDTGISAFRNPASGGGGGFFNPAAINFGSNPFV